MIMVLAIPMHMIGSMAFASMVDKSSLESETTMTSDLICGWTPGLNIPVAIHRPTHELIARSHVLVSALDSTDEVSTLPSVASFFSRMDLSHDQIGTDLLVSGETLLALIHEPNFFTGFDEIWLFRNPPRQTKPKILRLTSDVPLGDEPSDLLVSWMKGADCLAGLGDGDGLNFVTFDVGLAKLWGR